MKIEWDDGSAFGLGIFETIGVENGELQFFEAHYERLSAGADRLGISSCLKNALGESACAALREQTENAIRESGSVRGAVKIVVTEKNLLIMQRDNPYQAKDYEKGFVLRMSPVLRNETSMFTYLKSMNYGDNISEKRRAHREGFDEPVFLNTRGELTEGATTNIFLVKDGQMYTPPISCGLLDGIMRRQVMKKWPVIEKILYPVDALTADAMFVTNSLLGIMPVRQFEDRIFEADKRYTEIDMTETTIVQ